VVVLETATTRIVYRAGRSPTCWRLERRPRPPCAFAKPGLLLMVSQKAGQVVFQKENAMNFCGLRLSDDLKPSCRPAALAAPYGQKPAVVRLSWLRLTGTCREPKSRAAQSPPNG
jgi:hypothetical protein